MGSIKPSGRLIKLAHGKWFYCCGLGRWPSSHHNQCECKDAACKCDQKRIGELVHRYPPGSEKSQESVWFFFNEPCTPAHFGLHLLKRNPGEIGIMQDKKIIARGDLNSVVELELMLTLMSVQEVF